MIKSKKLSSLVAASLILAGGSLLGVQTVSAQVTDQQFNEVVQGVNANTQRIKDIASQLSASKDYSSDIAANKQSIDEETSARQKDVSNLQTNINNEQGARVEADKNLQNNLNKAVNAQAGINDTLTKAVTNNSKAIVANAEAAKNLEKHLTETDGRVDKANAEIHTNAGNIAQNKIDIAANKKAIGDEVAARQKDVSNLQTNINNEQGARVEADKNLQNNLNKAVNAQAGINDTLTKAVTNNSKAIVANAEAAKNLEKHLTETDGRVDKANAEIHTNAGNIAQSQKDIADIQDTLKNANAFASADATKAANEAAEKANTVANGLKDRVDLISNNQNVTSESDLIKKDQSVGQNLTNVDKALHKEISDRQAADDKLKGDMKKNLGIIQGQQDEQDNKIADHENRITANAGKIKNNQDAIKANSDKLTNHEDRITTNESNIEANANTLHKVQGDVVDNKNAIQKEISDRQAADDKLKGDMKKNLGIIQGQQDEQDNKIADHENRITANAGKIKNNQDAIKANSDKLTNHEDRITTNESNIEANANTLHKVQGDVVDNKNAISAEAAARGDKDKEHDTAIAANKKAIGDEAAARQADISRLDNKIHDVSKEVDTVGALSMAMSGLHPLSYDEGDARFQLSAAVGTYDGTEALALGGFYHFNRDSMLSVGVATDLGADEHRMGANVGYTRRIGQGGHVSRPSEGTVSDIMKDIKNLEQKQAKLEQENEQLKQQLAALKK